MAEKNHPLDLLTYFHFSIKKKKKVSNEYPQIPIYVV